MEGSDGGRWYVTLAGQDADGCWSPGEIGGDGWCAWYADIEGVKYAAVRSPEPVSIPLAIDVPVASVLAAAGCEGVPLGLVGGR